MVERYYFEVDFLCIVILLSLIWQTHRSNFKEKDQIQFIEVLIYSLLFVISDLVWIINNGFLSVDLVPSIVYPLFVLMNAANSLLPGLTAFSWLRFSECVQNRTLTKKQLGILSIPLILLFLCIVSNPFTHLLFSIENKLYIRTLGPMIEMIVAYFYIFISVYLSLKYAKQAKSLQEKKKALSVASFVILPTIAAVFQYIFFDMPIIFVGVILSLINVYIALQNQLILGDELTGLYNRSILDQKIEGAIESLDDDSELWVLMIDANRFKIINDTYGHLEGDRALIYIAKVLKEVCQKKSDYICRYGGDEFVVIYQCKKGQGCQSLIYEIKEKMKEHSSFPLSVSIGSALYQEKHKNWQDLLKEADQNLYKDKKI